MTRRTPRRRWPLATLLTLVSSLLLLLAATGSASAATVVNGGFETGNFSGWTQRDQNEFGEWFVIQGTTPPISSGERRIAEFEEELEEADSVEEQEFLEELIEEAEESQQRGREEGFGVVPAPIEGNYDAVADDEFVSSMVLYQDVALEPGQTHQLSMYLNYKSTEPIAAPNTLEVEEPETMLSERVAPRVESVGGGPDNQQVRVDVMKAASPVISMNPADILATVFATPTGGAMQMPWTQLKANLSPFAGQTVRIRIAVVDNDGGINAGVDAVSIASAPVAPPVPSNVFKFGKLKKNTKNGSATLTVDVPGPGTLSLAGVGGKGAKASISATKAKKPKKPKTAVKLASATATAAGAVSLAIKPTAAAKKYLKAKGSLSTKVAVTFTPTGGSASTLTTTVPLKLTKARPKAKK